MNLIKDNEQYIRSTAMEDEAINRIADLFSTQWETISQKSPREITALVLETIAAACLTQEKKQDTPESLKLLHANQFFMSTSSLLRSQSPLGFAITGISFNDTLENLRRIRKQAEKEENGSEIRQRLNFFINRLQEVLDLMVKEESKKKSFSWFILIVLVIFLVGLILGNDTIMIGGGIVLGCIGVYYLYLVIQGKAN